MKRKVVIACLCGLFLAGTVYAAAGAPGIVAIENNTEQENSNIQRSNKHENKKNEEITNGELSTEKQPDMLSFNDKIDSQLVRATTSSVQEGKLIPFTAEEYTDNFQRDEAQYLKRENEVDYDSGEYSNDSIADEADNTIEFVTYMDQKLTGAYSSFIVTNLSSNKYSMNFYIYNGNDLLATIKDVEPGAAESAELVRLLGEGDFTLTVISEAVSSNGAVLDSLEQEVNVSISDVAGKETASGTEKKNQPSGSTYETSVVYDAESMQCSVVLPAVLHVAKGDVGTDFDISYRIVGVKSGTKFSLTATNGLDADNAIKLITTDGANGKISTVNANLKMGSAGNNLDFILDTEDSVLHTVGPVHCFLSNNKIANGNYYGTTRFRINIVEG